MVPVKLATGEKVITPELELMVKVPLPAIVTVVALQVGAVWPEEQSSTEPGTKLAPRPAWSLVKRFADWVAPWMPVVKSLVATGGGGTTSM